MWVSIGFENRAQIKKFPNEENKHSKRGCSNRLFQRYSHAGCSTIRATSFQTSCLRINPLAVSSRIQDDCTGYQQVPHLTVHPSRHALGCIQCQGSKVSTHTRTAVGSFSPAPSGFEHIHIPYAMPNGANDIVSALMNDRQILSLARNFLDVGPRR